MKLIDKKLADLKAAQESGKYRLCPRCGRDTMKPDLYTNALSRIADIMVCDCCGLDEAMMAFMKTHEDLYSWAGLQPDKPESDFKELSGDAVWKRICDEQATVLSRLYERFEAGEDDREIRLSAFESCPGLIQIWTQPFVMKYASADGSVIVHFKLTESGLQMLAGLAGGEYGK